MMKLFYVEVWRDSWHLLPVIAMSQKKAAMCAGYFGVVGDIIEAVAEKEN